MTPGTESSPRRGHVGPGRQPEGAAAPASTPPARVWRWLAPALVAGLTMVVFANSFAGQFVYDDPYHIRDNPRLRLPLARALPAMLASSRPVVELSLYLNYAVGGLHPWGYHAVNLAVHLAAALLLLGILRRTFQSPPLAGRFGAAAWPLATVIAGLWAIHPLQVNAVTYIIQRGESMMGMCYLLTLWAFLSGQDSPQPTGAPGVPAGREGRGIRGIRGGRGSRGLWLAVSAAACFVGMFCKPVMVTAPLVMLLYDRTFLSGSLVVALRRNWPAYAAYVGSMGLLVLVVATAPAAGSAGFESRGLPSPWAYLLSQPEVILRYLRLVFWPTGMVIDYGSAWTTPTWTGAGAVGRMVLPGLVVLAPLAATAWALFRWGRRPACHRPEGPNLAHLELRDSGLRPDGRRDACPTGSNAGPTETEAHPIDLCGAAGFAGAWFFLILAPTSSILPIADPIYEHRMYLSLAAVLAVVVAGAYRLGRRAMPRRAMAACAWSAVVLAAASLSALTIGRNALYADDVALWQDVLHKRPTNMRAQDNLGHALYRLGRYAQARTAFEATLLHLTWDDPALARPGTAQAVDQARAQTMDDTLLLGLGLVYAQVGEPDRAVQCLERLVGLRQRFLKQAGVVGLAEAHAALAGVLSDQGRAEEAVPHFAKALELGHVHRAAVLANYGLALYRLQRFPEAVERYRQSLALDPSDAQVGRQLSAALAKTDPEQAIARYLAVLQREPNNAAAHNSLGNVYFQLNRLPEAIEHYEAALRIDARLPEAQCNLADALVNSRRAREAVPHYLAALGLKPDYAQAHYNLAQVYQALGQPEQARPHFEAARKLGYNP